jgi:hypothetical protein
MTASDLNEGGSSLRDTHRDTAPAVSGHTPGPLTVREDQSKTAWRIETGTGEWVASIYADYPEHNAEADARLIAAAPDLLEACQNFKGLYDTPAERRRRADDPFYAEAIEHLRAAISRATGEA